MVSITKDYIRENIADSEIIFERGRSIFRLGSYYLREADNEKKSFLYLVDGNYGDYDVEVTFDNGDIHYSCNCPYHSDGCKHTVAVCLDIIERLLKIEPQEQEIIDIEPSMEPEFLTYTEIREQALESRKKSSKTEEFKVIRGETFKGEHMVINTKGREYIVTLHEPEKGNGHCTCPDFNSNRLGTCKHLIHLVSHLKSDGDFKKRVEKEKFPFVHIYWDSSVENPVFFYDRVIPEEVKIVENFFNEDCLFNRENIIDIYDLIEGTKGEKAVKIDSHVLKQLDKALFQREIESIGNNYRPVFDNIKTELYPYQKEGVNFSVFKKSAVIADEMGLGKTLQAITLALMKKELFNFTKTLIIAPASLKEQWKREIEKFTDESVTVIAGTKKQRQDIYALNKDFFKVTNYEAVLRDKLAIDRFRPDLVILDEAQRIKNFETKTHQAIITIPHKQSLVITGTPLENKLEDLYSIMQFVDNDMMTPLWEFAAEHFIIRRDKRSKIAGYKNLDIVHNKLKSIVIRRKKEEVLKDLPEEVKNNYFIELSKEQTEIHQGYLASLLPLLNKKFLTPLDLRRIQEILLSMRMVCDSTYLIDKKTNISPKLRELEGVLSDLVIENRRKTVIFSEWTTMTFLIGKVLSEMGIPFVEFTGKVPVAKRDVLIKEFNENPECMVFLSTDAGGVGLNLQVADCVVNFELPWNPAKLNQRTGRVMRIGQKSKCINVVNFIARRSIEEKVFAGLNLKQELFNGVFDGTTDQVEFTQEKKNQFINNLREMLNDELIMPVKERGMQEDIPESTPHFLNPKALAEREIDISLEEEVEEASDEKSNVLIESGKSEEAMETQERSHEKMEEVLERGIQFLSGLMEMSTGKPLVSEKEEKAVSIDKETGEVTLKFKLPVF